MKIAGSVLIVVLFSMSALYAAKIVPSALSIVPNADAKASGLTTITVNQKQSAMELERQRYSLDEAAKSVQEHKDAWRNGPMPMHVKQASGKKPCHRRALTGSKDLEGLMELVQEGEKVKGSLASSALFEAIEKGSVDNVTAALNQNRFLVYSRKGYCSVLHLAFQPAEKEPVNDQIVEALVGAGAEPNALDQDRRTPLHYAALCGADRNSVLLLLKARAMRYVKDRLGNTAFYYAIMGKHVDLVKFFIEQDFMLTFVDSSGMTPIKWAVEYLSQGSGDEKAAVEESDEIAAAIVTRSLEKNDKSAIAALTTYAEQENKGVIAILTNLAGRNNKAALDILAYVEAQKALAEKEKSGCDCCCSWWPWCH